jgi:hypothetical protein
VIDEIARPEPSCLATSSLSVMARISRAVYLICERVFSASRTRMVFSAPPSLRKKVW